MIKQMPADTTTVRITDNSIVINHDGCYEVCVQTTCDASRMMVGTVGVQLNINGKDDVNFVETVGSKNYSQISLAGIFELKKGDVLKFKAIGHNLPLSSNGALMVQLKQINF